MSKSNNLLIITSALPYANGPLHFGHLLEHIQTDIWVRTNRAMNKKCIYICASDAHGTPIMLKAEEEGVTPEDLIEEVTEQQKNSLVNFNIQHDNYYTTHSEENKYFSEHIFNSADKKGLILRKKIKQLFDDTKGLFLADRYVQGEC
ncbi:MAG: class I tRNA ligase family protein, partial [Pseudomonadota bacterium]|nr:class I tRNA ligase family protein [Pseudomonadota bacterium]MEC7465689.1 class I tRNA ligase family protein [Pseudomonadota bacterium]MEC8108781.1 class I tRNA ligase family protein [Pseudomonadota bacterium]MEC8169100.1 class I tRNA ligase family protein [Pseudomonadota bacterium]